ncbi:cyclin-like protein [Westerdykella ornata]|uniref:Cyclin-like protein n=1 Tax=Westerdykella ornata TaxID=318751 RepID=A0A6A6JB63_WESOR|nr:cyclin-like protein [Westerdykella ornata]KAF2273860.1 cyclin-like protein [Westerdykella ornata]
MKLTEDDIYRTSTQYQHWTFTAAQLAAQRLQTNIQASERVRAAVARQRAPRSLKAENASASETERGESGANTPVLAVDREVNCLTVGEEKKLVDTFCKRALDLGDFLKLPIEVTATGVQYMRRFYLLNSPMTYDPQTISRSVIFIASKAEGHHLSVERYASSLPKTTPADILAPEYLITQALRFNYEVRHPFRGLKGGHLELMALAQGKPALLPTATQSAQELQTAMLALPRKPDGPATSMTVAELEKRITDAYGLASHILKTAALLTDAYFLYTPSHIWLSAHLLADEPLTLFYLSTKLPLSSPMHDKLLSTLRACSTLLSSHPISSHPLQTTASAEQQKKEKEEIGALLKKLRQCRDPDKIDLVKLNQAQKRDVTVRVEENGGEGLEESKAKRRKVARERAEREADEFWGPSLKRKDEEGSGGNLEKNGG